MNQNHFNRSLSPVTKGRTIAVVKWTFRAKIKVTMMNGGAWHGKGEAIIIRRADVEHAHDYARSHCKLRDFLLVRVPMKIGLRTSELRTLCIEHINFEAYEFQVLDSKKKRFSEQPLDGITLQFMKDLIGDRVEGPVFTREDSWKIRRENKPLSRVAIWHIVHKIGLQVGIKDFSPRTCRHYFACKWVEDMKNPDSSKTLDDLRVILRHASLLTTTFYVAKLRFFEDIKKAYHEMQEPYIDTRELSDFYREHCARCDREPTCKFVDQASANPYASGCRFEQRKKEVTI